MGPGFRAAPSGYPLLPSAQPSDANAVARNFRIVVSSAATG
jgi:hypothetical protein